MNKTYFGDCRTSMRALYKHGVRVQMCVTSPPYWGLRDYGVDGQLGLEATPDEYVANMVEVFRLVRDLLADDGTLWLNLGDMYNAAGREGHGTRIGYKQSTNRASGAGLDSNRPSVESLKQKDLIGMPWMLAFALRADGWYLRQDIIWHKPNPMPESVRDRCTKAHEYLFLLSKSGRYYFDHEAISERVSPETLPRRERAQLSDARENGVPGQSPHGLHTKRSGNKARKPATERDCPRDGVAGSVPWEGTTRNRRSVWTVTTRPYKGAHFATFPPALIEPCILAGSRPGDIVLDPFMGSGTTAQVAQALGRKWIGCELNPEYEALQRERTAQMGIVA